MSGSAANRRAWVAAVAMRLLLPWPLLGQPTGAPSLPPPGELARAKALIDAGQPEAARARLRPLVDQHPAWARATALLALTYYKQQRYEVAAPLFARALALDPSELATLPFQGWSLYALGQLDGAASAFERLLRALPDYAPAHYALGQIALDRDDRETARRRFEATAQLAAQQDDTELAGRARARLGDLAARRGDLPAARERLAALVASSPAATAVEPGLRFTPVPDAAGVDLVMTSGAMPSREILEVNGGGIALLDFDRDGDLDVFLANGATLADPEHGPGSRLYANHGDGSFEDVTGRTGIDLHRWAMGVAVGDVDGDGWDDLYVTCFGPNVLLRNEPAPGGGRRFRDASLGSGVDDPRWSTSAAFADLDADGDLDLFVVNYLAFDPRHPPSRAGKAFRGKPVMAGPRGLVAQPDALYENLGGGRFREVMAAGLVAAPDLDYGLSVRIADFDGDGRPDIFVGNDSTPDQLYRNLGGLRFEEVALLAGVAVPKSGSPQATMGIGQADVDGNGHLDLFLTVFSDDTNTLHLNLGGGLFDDRSGQFGLAAVSRPFLGWGCGFYDFDLDGDEDLLLANGHVYPEMDDPEVAGAVGAWAERPLLFARQGARFEPAPCAALWCEQRIHGRAVAFGDLDGDRDVDAIITTLNGPVLVLRNDAAPRPSLVVRLDDPPPNRHGVGSVIEVVTPAGVQRRWLTGGGSFQSADAPDAYFGLGDLPAGARVTVRVRGPRGDVRTFTDVAVNQVFVVTRAVTAP